MPRRCATAPIPATAAVPPAPAVPQPSLDPDGLARAAAALPAGADLVAWTHLLGLWRADPAQVEVREAARCPARIAPGLSCLRGSGNLAKLRALGLPVLLVLHPGGRRTLALLLALDEDGARLDLGTRTITVPYATLDQAWLGQYLVVWREPAFLPETVRRGEAGAAVDWVQAQLARFDTLRPAASGPYLYDETMEARVRQVQAGFGLVPDGIVGPGDRAGAGLARSGRSPPRPATGLSMSTIYEALRKAEERRRLGEAPSLIGDAAWAGAQTGARARVAAALAGLAPASGGRRDCRRLVAGPRLRTGAGTVVHARTGCHVADATAGGRSAGRARRRPNDRRSGRRTGFRARSGRDRTGRRAAVRAAARGCRPRCNRREWPCAGQRRCGTARHADRDSAGCADRADHAGGGAGATACDGGAKARRRHAGAVGHPRRLRQRHHPSARCRRPRPRSRRRPAVASALAPTGSPGVPLLYEMPLGTRQALPPLKLSMHVYSPDPARRVVIIDGARLLEGEIVSGESKVSQITSDGVVLQLGDQVFLLPRGGR